MENFNDYDNKKDNDKLDRFGYAFFITLLVSILAIILD